MIGAILSAAAPSIVSGLFGSNDQTTTSTVDYEQMVQSAEAAGFNPLTALRNGGSSGFSTTTTSAQLSSGKFIADALGKGYEAFKDEKNAARNAEIERIELDTMRQNLKNLQLQEKAYTQPNFGFAIPRVEQYTGQHESNSISDKGVSPTVTVSNPDRTSISIGGVGVKPDHGFSDAEEAEKRYGDVGGAIYGLAVGGADLFESNKQKLKDYFGVRISDVPTYTQMHKRPKGRPKPPSPYISSTLTSAF